MMTGLRVPLAGGALALLLGVVAVIWGGAIAGPLIGLVPRAVWLGVLFFAAAFLLGVIWPGPSWAWGVWVALPMALFLLLSVGFTGQLGAFVRHDLVPLGAAVAGALAGGWLGAVAREALSRAKEAAGA